MTAVSLVGYGLGNLGSVVNMFKRIGVTVRVVETPEQLLSSDRIVLPGVGAFDLGVSSLQSRGLDMAITEFAARGNPVLGICLGMQLLLDSSDEGSLPGLGLIAGRSRRFSESDGIRVPHMGWNLVQPLRADDLLTDLPEQSRFYFVHSYWVEPSEETSSLAVTVHGKPFTSMVRSGNIMGAQFHPEKSHVFGMRVLSNFAAL